MPASNLIQSWILIFAIVALLIVVGRGYLSWYERGIMLFIDGQEFLKLVQHVLNGLGIAYDYDSSGFRLDVGVQIRSFSLGHKHFLRISPRRQKQLLDRIMTALNDHLVNEHSLEIEYVKSYRAFLVGLFVGCLSILAAALLLTTAC